MVGDAACGLAYFRSLNNGLLCASVLATCLHAYRHSETIVYQNAKWDPLKFYTWYVNFRYQKERKLAEAKNLGLTLLIASLTPTRAFPIAGLLLSMTPQGHALMQDPQNKPQHPPAYCFIS